MAWLASDERAASPLTVIALVVLVAAGVTAIAVMAFFGGGPSAMTVQQVDGPEGAGIGTLFQVTSTNGGLDWQDVTVQFVDPAGVDRSGIYLEAPTGPVDPGDQIRLRTQPPAGTYLLRVMDGHQELARVSASF